MDWQKKLTISSFEIWGLFVNTIITIIRYLLTILQNEGSNTMEGWWFCLNRQLNGYAFSLTLQRSQPKDICKFIQGKENSSKARITISTKIWWLNAYGGIRNLENIKLSSLINSISSYKMWISTYWLRRSLW